MTTAYDVCVVGLGPAGLGTAIGLAETPGLRMLCLDSGPAVGSRFCSILDRRACRWAMPCEMISGVGGASLLSGGKLSVYPAGRGMDALVGGPERTARLLDRALRTFQERIPLLAPEASEVALAAAAESFNASGFTFRHYDSYRYLRMDLVAGYDAMCRFVSGVGHDIRVTTSVEDVERTGGKFKIALRNLTGTDTVMASQLVLATGRSGGRLLSRIGDRFAAADAATKCDAGVRLEFPYECWPDIDECHNDLKLEFGTARTFCVCVHGGLAPYRVDDIFVLEGHSEPGSSTGLTNLGILIRSSEAGPELFDEIAVRTRAEGRGLPVRESLQNFLNDSAEPDDELLSSITFWRRGRVARCFPNQLSDSIREAVRRFGEQFLPRAKWPQIGVFGPEIDYYWPTIPVVDDFRTPIDGVFLAGDGTARFRGILQAFASGLHTADTIKRDAGHAS